MVNVTKRWLTNDGTGVTDGLLDWPRHRYNLNEIKSGVIIELFCAVTDGKWDKVTGVYICLLLMWLITRRTTSTSYGVMSLLTGLSSQSPPIICKARGGGVANDWRWLSLVPYSLVYTDVSPYGRPFTLNKKSIHVRILTRWKKIANEISPNYTRKHIYRVTILLHNICNALQFYRVRILSRYNSIAIQFWVAVWVINRINCAQVNFSKVARKKSLDSFFIIFKLARDFS